MEQFNQPLSAYQNPHYVMLFFERNIDDNNAEHTSCLAVHDDYYRRLKDEGKVAFSGNFWTGNKKFVILSVSSDAELEYIIDNDPAAGHEAIELIKALPFFA